MLPTSTQVVIRGALQNASIMYRNESYIGDRVFPIIDGLNRQSKVLKYAKRPWFANEAAYRAEGTTAARGDYGISSVNLDPKQVAIGKAVTDELLAASGEPGSLPVQPVMEALLYCADKIDLFKEKLIADTVFAGTWADGASGGTDKQGGWATASSNPFVVDILAAKKAIQNKTGVLPNALLIDYNTYNALQNADCIIDKVKYVQKSVVTADLIAGLLDLDEVMVGTSLYTTDKQKSPDPDTMTTVLNIWEKTATKGSAFLFYRPKSVGLRTPAAGYQYRLKLDGAPRKAVSYREESQHQSVYEVMEEIDIAPMDYNLGYLWKDTILT